MERELSEFIAFQTVKKRVLAFNLRSFENELLSLLPMQIFCCQSLRYFFLCLKQKSWVIHLLRVWEQKERNVSTSPQNSNNKRVSENQVIPISSSWFCLRSKYLIAKSLGTLSVVCKKILGWYIWHLSEKRQDLGIIKNQQSLDQLLVNFFSMIWTFCFLFRNHLKWSPNFLLLPSQRKEMSYKL